MNVCVHVLDHHHDIGERHVGLSVHACMCVCDMMKMKCRKRYVCR